MHQTFSLKRQHCGRWWCVVLTKWPSAAISSPSAPAHFFWQKKCAGAEGEEIVWSWLPSKREHVQRWPTDCDISAETHLATVLWDWLAVKCAPAENLLTLSSVSASHRKRHIDTLRYGWRSTPSLATSGHAGFSGALVVRPWCWQKVLRCHPWSRRDLKR